jgi:hypothetical protein
MRTKHIKVVGILRTPLVSFSKLLHFNVHNFVASKFPQIVANWDVWHHFLTTLLETFPPSCEALQLNLNYLFRPNQHFNGWDLSCEALQLNLNYLLCPKSKIEMDETHHVKLFNWTWIIPSKSKIWMDETHHVKLFKLNLNYSVQIKIWMDETLSRQYLYSSPSITLYLFWNKFFLGTWTKIWEIVFSE